MLQGCVEPPNEARHALLLVSPECHKADFKGCVSTFSDITGLSNFHVPWTVGRQVGKFQPLGVVVYMLALCTPCL